MAQGIFFDAIRPKVADLEFLNMTHDVVPLPQRKLLILLGFQEINFGWLIRALAQDTSLGSFCPAIDAFVIRCRETSRH